MSTVAVRLCSAIQANPKNHRLPRRRTEDSGPNLGSKPQAWGRRTPPCSRFTRIGGRPEWKLPLVGPMDQNSGKTGPDSGLDASTATDSNWTTGAPFGELDETPTLGV